MAETEDISEVLHNVCLGYKNGHLIISSITEDDRRVNLQDFKSVFFPDGKSYEIEKMVLIHNPWTHNFQHFLDETLPLCIECKELPEVYVTLWPQFADDILNFLQIKNIKQIPENTCFHIKKLIRKKLRYVDFRLNEKCNVNKPLKLVRDTVDKFIGNKKPKTLFIRRDVEKRPCKNIEQLISALKLKFNIDVINNFSSLNVREKIIVLNYYDNIISMYGATSGNVLFKTKGKWLILSNPWSVNCKFIKNLNPDLNIYNVDYISQYLDSNSIGNHSGGVTEDKEFVIEIDKCIEKIKEIFDSQPKNQDKEKLST